MKRCLAIALGMAVLPVLPAAEFSFAPTTETTEWKVQWDGRPVMVYSFPPGRFKPYVKELCTLKGENLLRDAPFDHLHHHALMFAIRVNGINFWEEVPGSGVQRVVKTSAPETRRDGQGVPAAVLTQTIHWLSPQYAFQPDTAKTALLIEERTLTLRVEEGRREVALRWHSDFTVGTNAVALAGANYFGLGVRFRQDLDTAAEHLNAGGKPDLSGGKQDVSPHAWGSVSFSTPDLAATLAIFGDPRNAHGVPTFFTMKQPFAYLSATQGLDKEPLAYPAGAKYALDYLVTVYPEVVPSAALDARGKAYTNALERGERR